MLHFHKNVWLKLSFKKTKKFMKLHIFLITDKGIKYLPASAPEESRMLMKVQKIETRAVQAYSLGMS